MVYEHEHAKLLANTIERWLDIGSDARLVIQLPRRPRFEAELQSFCSELERLGLEILGQGDEEGWGLATGTVGGVFRPDLDVECAVQRLYGCVGLAG